MSAEQVAVRYIDGSLPVPNGVADLVEAYRAYAEERAECVSYPRYKDDEANEAFDLICEAAEEESCE